MTAASYPRAAVGADEKRATVDPLPERVRQLSAPLIALLGCSLGLCCVVSLVGVLRHLDSLVELDDRVIGWVGAASMLSLVVAAGVINLSGRVGSGPALMLGVVAGVAGLTLADDLSNGPQLALSLLLLGFGSGGLVSGSLCMAMELPRGWARTTLVAWSLPITLAWPVLAWFSNRGTTDDVALTLHPAEWLVAVVALAITAWAVATMLLNPDRLPASRHEPWQDAWSVLLLACGVALLMVMLLGFDSGIGPTWLRPVVIVTTCLTAAGWVWLTRLIPEDHARPAVVASGLVAMTLPSVTQLLTVVGDSGESRVRFWWLLVLGVGALAGHCLGWRLLPGRVIPYGLMGYAIAAAAAWVVPGRPSVMVAVAVPLLASAGAVLTSSLLCCLETRGALRFLGVVIIAAVCLGLVFALPLTWAVSGDLAQLTEEVDEVRAMARVLLGLTFSASVLAAAYTWILTNRTRRAPLSVPPDA